ncbi:hypothetical protein BSZ39_11020 [Bowdeniella nasicola]|uniref:Peptidase C39-like domain-containing protein n=1 Tax=Bowdeniella nasicola TaxID=208480 RepID=A0A1Q5Q046_9ACTO|nr:hypothetical protein [Bowdeniella nasicola]OKL53147.1 hypothetical protein BSZ39_11020 [Bowdeniella nasicola]
MPAQTRELRSWPVELGGHRLQQCDETSCGAAALVMLAATGDARLASWLSGTNLPPEASLPEVPSWAMAAAPPAHMRFEIAQRHVRSRMRGWPSALGTLPSSAAKHARFRHLDYHVTWLPAGAPRRAAGIRNLVGIVKSGIPCLLYVGGTAPGPLTTRVPRHVIVAVPAKGGSDGDTINLYEPDSAALYRLPISQLDDDRPKAAFGNWSHVYAIVAPKATEIIHPSPRGAERTQHS